MENRQLERFEIREVLTDRWYHMTAYPSEEGISVRRKDIAERTRAEEVLRAS
jgi:hypothetical protein